MRFRTARVLSVGGMLATATAVTTYSQFLSSAPVTASASSSSSPSSTPGSGSVSTTPPASAPVAVTPAPVPGSATQFSYVAGDAATVIVDSAGGTLRVVTFAPLPGWFTVRLDQPSATQLEVRLESTAGQVRFAARLENGAVVAELESSSTPGTSAPGNSAPGNSAPGGSSPSTSSPGGDDGGGRDDDHGGDGGDDDSGGGGNSGPGGGG